MKPGSVEVGEAKPNEGAPRRSFASPDKLTSSPSPDIKVLADIMQAAVKKFPDVRVSAPACGSLVVWAGCVVLALRRLT